MSKNEQLYKDAEKAISKLFSDTSVTKEIAVDNLISIKEVIENYLEML